MELFFSCSVRRSGGISIGISIDSFIVEGELMHGLLVLFEGKLVNVEVVVSIIIVVEVAEWKCDIMFSTSGHMNC